MESETKNARIESTMLGVEDHGIMTFMLTLDYGGSGQGAGGICLDMPWKPRTDDFTRIGTAAGLSMIMRVLEVVGVEKWEDLRGKVIRVRATWTKVEAIGNYLKDDWLVFEDFFPEFIRLHKLGGPVKAKPFKPTRLGDLRPGAVFVTAEGVFACKSEYSVNNGDQCECVLLESGEYGFFPKKDQTVVREVYIPAFHDNNF